MTKHARFKRILGFACYHLFRLPCFHDHSPHRFYYLVLSWAGYWAHMPNHWPVQRTHWHTNLRCRMLVNEDRGRAIAEATHWLKTYCRHWATVGQDTQTMDNLTAEERITARQHMGTLRRLGLLKEGGFRGNFEVMT